MFRKSNLVPNSVSSIKPEKQLSRKNIVYDPTSAETTQTVDNQYPDINVIIKLH
jgi:hypothetical protein